MVVHFIFMRQLPLTFSSDTEKGHDLVAAKGVLNLIGSYAVVLIWLQMRCYIVAKVSYNLVLSSVLKMEVLKNVPFM